MSEQQENTIRVVYKQSEGGQLTVYENVAQHFYEQGFWRLYFLDGKIVSISADIIALIEANVLSEYVDRSSWTIR